MPAYANATVTKSSSRLLTAIFDLSRVRQALLSIAQPALGAVIALRGLPSLGTSMLGLIAAASGFLAVFSLNDILDKRVDSKALLVGKGEFEGFDLDTTFSRHPLARGDISMKTSLAWAGSLATVSMICAYLLSPWCLALFGLAVALEVVYCALKSVTWAKTLISGAMVGVGGLAGWIAVAPLGRGAVPFFIFLALWEIAGRNLPNDLSDLIVDGKTQIRTVATVFGPHVSARATLAGALLMTGAIVLLPAPSVGVVLSIGAALWAVVLPAIDLVRNPTGEQAASYFNRASLLPALMLPLLILASEAVRP